MKKSKNISDNKLWTIDSQGNLQFSTRNGKLEDALDTESNWEKPVVATIVMLLCLVLDFVVFKQVFAFILSDNVWLQWFSIIGCLIPFDIGPIFLGIELKKRAQGLNDNRFIEYALIGIFSMIFFGNLWLRLVVKDSLVPANTMVTNSFFTDSTEIASTNPAALPYAIFSSLLPLATSVVSGVVSFTVANPLKTKLCKVRAQKVELENHINELDAVLSELDANKKMEDLEENDINMLSRKVQHIKELGLFYADYVRQKIKEHGGDAAGTNELSKNMHDLILQNNLPDVPSETNPMFKLENGNC